MFIKENKLDLIAIFDHRINDKKASRTMKSIVPGWNWCSNMSATNKGRIWIVCNPTFIDFNMIENDA